MVRNLSSGGMFVESLESLPPGTTIKCVFELRDSDPPIDCFAEIKRIKGGQNLSSIGWVIILLPCYPGFYSFATERSLSLRASL